MDKKMKKFLLVALFTLMMVNVNADVEYPKTNKIMYVLKTEDGQVTLATHFKGLNIDNYYCVKATSIAKEYDKPAQKTCNAINTNYKKIKDKKKQAELNEEKYYVSENNPKGINSDDEMDKDIIAYSKEAAKYNLCGDYNSGMGDLGNYSIYYYNAVTTKYDRELIKRYGDRGKVEEAIANKLDNLVEKEKFRLVHEGIPSTMCENLESLDRDY